MLNEAKQRHRQAEGYMMGKKSAERPSWCQQPR